MTSNTASSLLSDSWHKVSQYFSLQLYLSRISRSGSWKHNSNFWLSTHMSSCAQQNGDQRVLLKSSNSDLIIPRLQIRIASRILLTYLQRTYLLLRLCIKWRNPSREAIENGSQSSTQIKHSQHDEEMLRRNSWLGCRPPHGVIVTNWQLQILGFMPGL